jgi:L-rhamnose mutarotase
VFLSDFTFTEGTEIDELCPSMYSFHSDINEKNKLLHIFYEAGIETTVDRVAKKERIRQWIQNSVINEEDENEVSIQILSQLHRVLCVEDQRILLTYSSDLNITMCYN